MKSKKKVITVSAIAGACVLLLITCILVLHFNPNILSVFNSKRNFDDCIKYATKKYGMEKVIFYSTEVRSIYGFVVNGELIDEETYSEEDEFSHRYTYVAGIKNDRIVALVFSKYKSEKICESEWIFDIPCENVVEMFNDRIEGEFDTVAAMRGHIFIESIELDYDELIERYPELDGIISDKPLVVDCDHMFLAVQSCGQIHILERVFNSNN